MVQSPPLPGAVSTALVLLLIFTSAALESPLSSGAPEHHVRHLRHQLGRLEHHAESPLLQDDDKADKMADMEVGGPRCPPSVRPVSPALCDVRKCFSHAECRPQASEPPEEPSPELQRALQRRACCYNGCVYSCMHRMPPPAVFDWIEDTPDYVTGSGNASAEEGESWHGPWLGRRGFGGRDDDYVAAAEDAEADEELSAHLAPPDVVALSGGCVLTHSEYLDLQKFQKSRYIKQCFCNHGEVFCKVEHATSSAAAAAVAVEH